MTREVADAIASAWNSLPPNEYKSEQEAFHVQYAKLQDVAEKAAVLVAKWGHEDIDGVPDAIRRFRQIAEWQDMESALCAAGYTIGGGSPFVSV